MSNDNFKQEVMSDFLSRANKVVTKSISADTITTSSSRINIAICAIETVPDLTKDNSKAPFDAVYIRLTYEAAEALANGLLETISKHKNPPEDK